MLTLTGHSERGWVIGEVTAVDAISFWQKQGQPVQKPVLEVKKNDVVVLKLMSSDVVHGFSLKDFGVFLTDGIQPGKAVYVSFKADKVGTFTFSCNAICGDIHQNMQGWWLKPNSFPAADIQHLPEYDCCKVYCGRFEP
jgi:nitrous oxide reductase